MPLIVLLAPAALALPAADTAQAAQAGQAAQPASSAATFARYARYNRFEEDYRALPPAERRGFPMVLKGIPLADDIRLSLGGDYRFRAEAYDNSAFGLLPGDDYAAVENRVLFHANLTIGPAWRAFVQLGGASENGREPAPFPGERTGPDLIQGFVE